MSKLKQKRLALQWKLKDLAEQLQMTQQGVYQQEQRGILTIRTAQRYAAALHCNPFELIELNSSASLPKRGHTHE